MDLTVLNNKDIQDFEKSDLSVVSFAGVEKKRNSLQPSPENPFGINAEGGDEFFKKICTEKENQFTLDLNDMSYKQFGDGNVEDKLYEKLRKEAIEKINKTNQQIRDEEQEEEESSSSSGSYESIEEENLSDNELSSKKKNDDISSKDSKDISFNQQEKENKINNNKNNFLSIDNNISHPPVTPKNLIMNLDQFKPKNNISNNNINNTHEHAKNNKKY